MRSKRLFAILLAFVMVFSAIAPGVNAIAPGETEQNAAKPGVIEATKSESSSNSLLANPQGVSNTLRDKYGVAVSEKETTGRTWTFAEKEMDLDLFKVEKAECFAELKAAAEQFGQDEIVAAFVVMESSPLSEKYSSISRPTFGEEESLIAAQNKVIDKIEKSILGGAELEVRYQFTYLTNSFTIRTEFKNLSEIAKLDGVKSVFIMPVYNPCTVEDVMVPNTAASGEMTGVHNVWKELGYTGAGMTIGIIDTGLDLDHPSFAADPETNANSMTVEDIAAVLEDLNAYAYRRGDLTAEDLYNTAKVPYAFNYVDNNLFADHSRDNQGDHGTHVAGIAAANALETTTVVGMAPDAQIVVMKVFGANGGAYTDDIVAAVEDAMTLGCDVVNASLGSPAGFASSDTEIDLIYARIAEQDTVVVFSAGNEGTSSYMNMWGTDLNRTQNPDNATVGSPATYANTFAIASAENSAVMTDYFALADGTKIFFQDSIEAIYASAGYPEYQGAVSLKILADESVEYVIVPGLGSPEDVASVDVAGKIAVIKRGELSFADKVMNAENAGAVGVLIWNNNDTDDIFTFGMTTAYADGSFPGIPSAIITMSDGQKLADAEQKSMTVAEEQASRPCAGGQMSSFSSWGPSPDLQLLPDITGVGGNVYSCYDGGTYGLMSGTSMSAPQLSGITALVVQHLRDEYPNLEAGALRNLAEAILMSTADPIVDADSEVEASPRQQGAGLVNAYEAVTSESYLTVNGGRPKAELGDNEEGVFEFSFEVHNMSDKAKTYTLSGSVLSETPANAGVAFFMYEMDMPLDSSTITFDAESITVPANGTVTVNACVELGANDKALLDYVWANGTYVEGFVYLTDEEGVRALNLPYMGFYGDWTDAPVFDTAYWYDNSFFGAPPVTGLPEGDEYYHVFWTTLAGTDWVLGLNPYSGPMMGADGKIIYDPAHNVLSPNGDGVMDGFEEIYLSLLRNAKTLTFTYTVDGEVIHEEVIINAPKTMYRSNYGQVIPYIHSWYSYERPFDFSGLESGTEVLLTISAEVDYADGGDHSIQIPITIDNEPGQLLAVYDGVLEDGTPVLQTLVADNVDVAAVLVMNANGTRIYGEAYDDYNLFPYDEGISIAQFDVTELGTELTVAVCDYAGNEVYYSVELTNVGENLPEVDSTALYAYRVYDNYIYSDHMYGWVSMNKPASADEFANISVLTDDYMEYAALTAAEYVGGKIIATDAVYNLVILNPGLFDRNVVGNLGVNVIDMTFDDSTDTMYVLSKSGYSYALYSLDILNAELTLLKNFGSSGPLAIADDDNGTLYGIRAYSANIFTLDVEGGTYAMTAVTDAEGNKIVVTDSVGSNCYPSALQQSITWADGKLYWAYYTNSYNGEASDLITVNTETWESYANAYASKAYDMEDNLVDYYPMTELVGLMVFNETEYRFPESAEATSIALDAQSMILQVGQSQTLKATCLPWNYKLDESQLVWTSSDESVVTVSANGTVLAVGKGDATVTVSYGNLTASCDVTSVLVSGNLFSYNMVSGDGYSGHMIAVDLATMDYSLLTDIAPVEFMSGAFNYHDGYFYGYDIGGQLYRYDLSLNEAVPVGRSLGTYPVDVAYDYNTGKMYALVLNSMTYENTLYEINYHSGASEALAVGSGLMNLAIDEQGNMYAMDAYGYLNLVILADYSEFGMGVQLDAMPIMEESFGDLYYLGGLCWDYENDVLLWNWVEMGVIVWMDPVKGYSLILGDPSESGLFEQVGMFTMPAEIPVLPDVAVENMTTEDMLMFAGDTKAPLVTVYPFNATCQNVEMTVADASVATVNEYGQLVALAQGETTVTVKLTDAISGKSFEDTFTLTVLEGTDNLYGHLLTDIYNYNAQLWIELDPSNPGTYGHKNEYFDYTIFTQEYYDGKLYTYGYNANEWTEPWQFFVLDADSKKVLTQIAMSEAFPYVYDMTYDYATSTMYALAGPSEDDTSLYVVNMETGTLTLLMELDQLMLAIAAGPDGKLYLIENSKTIGDPYDFWAPVELTNANLWSVDPLSCELTLIGDTGLKSNMISSMTYDYDSGNMFWSAFAQEAGYVSHLALLDLETGVATSLGTIGQAGAQVGGLYTICDEFPEEDFSVLHKLLMAKTKTTLMVGESKALDFVTMPSVVEGEITWKTSDRRVVTVDDNGVITGVSSGKARVTVTVSANGVSKSATCQISVLDTDAGFLAYNVTDGGWSMINRGDTTLVENLNEGEDLPAVSAIASIGTDVYGYDENNQLFKLNTETFERTNIGEAYQVEEGFAFDVKDMAYDVKNEQMLVLGDMLMWDDMYGEYSEIYGGCGLYVVDLTTGELEQLYVFNDYTFVYALAVGVNGEVYFYSTFDDGVNKLNLEDGTVSTVVTLQTQGIYGDMYCDYAMYYDDLTGNLFMLFTSNGNFYKMVTIDVTTGELTIGDYVGEVVEDGWYYMGDLFCGLTFASEPIEEHLFHSYVNGICACGEKEVLDYESRPSPFQDVEEGDYFFEPVLWAHYLGITAGTSETSFAPDANCTRAQIVTFLWRAAGEPKAENRVNPFVDVNRSAYYYEAVLWAVENGITSGTSKVTFSPDAKCTRAQAVTFLFRASGEEAPEGVEHTFKDLSEDAYYYEAVLWAVENGITSGTSAVTFAPDLFCTRGQIVTFLYREWYRD